MISTGDESWSVFTQTPTHRRIFKGEIPEEIEDPSQFQKKVMVTIVVTPDGKYFIDLLPKGQKYTADYFCQNIIPRLEDLAFPHGRINERKWLLYFDNSPIHKSF